MPNTFGLDNLFPFSENGGNILWIKKITFHDRLWKTFDLLILKPHSQNAFTSWQESQTPSVIQGNNSII